MINEDEIVISKADGGNTISADDDDVVKRIKELLENYVKPRLKWMAAQFSLRVTTMA